MSLNQICSTFFQGWALQFGITGLKCTLTHQVSFEKKLFKSQEYCALKATEMGTLIDSNASYGYMSLNSRSTADCFWENCHYFDEAEVSRLHHAIILWSALNIRKSFLKGSCLGKINSRTTWQQVVLILSAKLRNKNVICVSSPQLHFRSSCFMS